jgi:hypothetical protein
MHTRNINWTIVFIALNLILINWILYSFMNLDYPMVGHDYHYFIPQILDMIIYFLKNGATIQWYTPSFGGGVPAFPNPQFLQYSILEILSLWITPWHAIIVSSILYISVGFVASFRFFQKVLKLSPYASILGAIFFSANGFILQHIAVGHLGFQPFPTLAIILLLFFDPAIPSGVAGVLLGIMVALIIYQAGFFIIVVFCLSSLLAFPLVYFFRFDMFSWKRISITFLAGAAIALLLSASKLSAVYSFMRFFPRLDTDVYLITPARGIVGMILQFLGTMSLVPLFLIARLDPNLLPNYFINITGALYGYWEFDMSMSPVVYVIILIGMNRFLHAPRNYLKKYITRNNWGAILLFFCFAWLVVQFTLAHGRVYEQLQHLPILSSLHVNARFAAAFLFPFAFLAAVIYDSWDGKWPEKKSVSMFLLINLLTLIPLVTYFMLKEDLQLRLYDVSTSAKIYADIRSGKDFEVTSIDYQISNTQALQAGVSNINFYEGIFGYAKENFHPEIKTGSIWDISDGYFNMTNPSGYVFPDSNNTRPFERIKIQDREKLEAFANNRISEWKIPTYQKICNYISVVVLGLVVLFLCGYVTRVILRGRL